MLELTSSVKWINYWGRVLYDINNMLSLTLHGWHAILRAIINVQMSSRKKKRSCPFSLAKGRPKKVKNTFDEEWTAKLAESDKGSFNTKKNWWMNSITITKLKWAQVAVKYNCKKLSKQRKLTKRSGRSWKADQLFWHVTYVKEKWILWKTCYREMDLVHRGLTHLRDSAQAFYWFLASQSK